MAAAARCRCPPNLDVVCRSQRKSARVGRPSQHWSPTVGGGVRHVGYWHFSDMGCLTDDVCFSNRPFGVKHFQTIHPCGVDVARGLVLLFGIGAWPFHHGIRGRGGTIFRTTLPSVWRRVQADIRTHLIHRPARDIFPLLGGFRFSPIAFDPVRFSCCCCGLLPGPPELGAVNPDAVHNHGQPARQRHDRLLHPAAPGDLHGPRLEPRPFF